MKRVSHYSATTYSFARNELVFRVKRVSRYPKFMRKKIPKDQVVLPDPCGSFHAFMRKNFCVSEVRRGNRVNRLT